MRLIERSHGRRGTESGASTLQYIGITVLAAVIVGGIATALAPGVVLGAFDSAVCTITGAKNCRGTAGSSTLRKPTPLDRAVAGTVWQGGDSFASGEGIRDYYEETDFEGKDGKPKNMCHRSPGSYQAQMFRHFQGRGYFQGQDYKSHACSGSTASNLHKNNGQGNDEGPQGRTHEAEADSTAPYDKIPPDASLITMSLGGNDVGFGAVLNECIAQDTRQLCMNSEAVRAKMDKVYDDGKNIEGTLERQIKAIKAQHPDAQIILVGYPPLFAEQQHVASILFFANGMDLGEQRWANEEAVEMNRRIKAMAERTGVKFLDPTPPSSAKATTTASAPKTSGSTASTSASPTGGRNHTPFTPTRPGMMQWLHCSSATLRGDPCDHPRPPRNPRHRAERHAHTSLCILHPYPARRVALAIRGPSSSTPLDLASDAPQTRDAAEESASRILLRPTEVPGGTGKAGGPVTGGFRDTICGVDLEPHRPAAAFNARLQLDGGAQVIQSARPIGATRAKEIVAGLKKALASCTSYTTESGEDAGTYTVKPITFANPDVVGFSRQREGESLYSYYALIVIDDCLVAFMTLGNSDVPSPEGVQVFDSLIAASVKKAAGPG